MSEKSESKNIEMLIEMPEEMFVFLNQLSKVIRARGGGEIEIPALVRTVVEAFCTQDNFDISGITNEAELTERILRSYKKMS